MTIITLYTVVNMKRHVFKSVYHSGVQQGRILPVSRLLLYSDLFTASLRFASEYGLVQ